MAIDTGHGNHRHDNEGERMPIKVLKLRVRFVVEPDDEGFYAYCPDLKGLHVGGATESEALENAKDAAEAYISSLLKHQDPIPVGMVESAHESLSQFLWQRIRDFFRPRRHSYVKEVTYCPS